MTKPEGGALRFVVEVLLYSGLVFWFMWVLLVASIAMAGAKQLRADNAIFALLATATIFALPDGMILTLLKFMFPFFCAGYLFARHEKLLSPNLTRYKDLILVAAVLASIAVFPLWNENTYVYKSGMVIWTDNFEIIVFRFFASAVLSIAALCVFYKVYRHLAPGLFTNFGRSSLQIYIMQFYVYGLVSSALTTTVGLIEPQIAYSFAVAPLLALVITFSLYLLGQALSNFKLSTLFLFGHIQQQK